MNNHKSLITTLALTGLLAVSASADPYQDIAKYKFGDSREPITTIEAEIREATPQQYPAIEAKLLAVLQTPDTTVDAKRYLARLLGICGSSKSVPALAALLGDEQLSDPARIALEPMPNAEAGKALRQALGQLKGKLLIGMIGSVGARRDPEAIPALRGLITDADPAVATAALGALGEIGTEAAAKVLNEAGSVPDALQRPLARARLACARRLTEAGRAAVAVPICQSLLNDTKQPAFIRAGALTGLIAAEDRGKAVAMVSSAVQGDDVALRAVAVRAFYTSKDSALQRAVVDKLATLNSTGQTVLMAVLPDLAEVPARAGILQVLQASGDSAVRLAALECLVTHGEAADVPLLLKLGTAGGAEGDVAKSVLERMHNPKVNDGLAGLLASSDAANRPAIIGLMGKRRVTNALPTLAELVASTEDDNVRNAVSDAIGSICGRAEDRPACATSLIGALDRGRTPVAKVAVLGLLPRVRTDEALAAVQRATKDANPQVSEAAVRALADWPEIVATTPLLQFARGTKDEKLAVLALRGCVRLAGLKEAPAAERLKILKGVLEAAQRPDEKRQALAGVAGVSVIEALEVVQPYLKDSAMALDAATATIRLATDLGAVHRNRFEKVLAEIKALPGMTDAVRKSADAALAGLKSSGMTDGYITAWLLAGPYTKEGKNGPQLFDEVFPPEQSGAPGVSWRVANAEEKGGARILRLDKILGGNDRVAYVRTQIESTQAQEIMLENGSDDGVKVWLNNEVVLKANVTRPCSPGSEKVKLKLRAGVNTLLVKLTQGGGEWELCIRLRATGGDAAPGIAVAPSLD